MKVLVTLALALSLVSCHGEWKRVDHGTIKEKFITSDKYGTPEYHIVTNKHVYDVSGDEYAQNRVGEHFIDNIYCFN